MSAGTDSLQESFTNSWKIKPFKEVTALTHQIGKMKAITSNMQAAEWSATNTERLDIAKEADVYVGAVGRPPSTGKLEKAGIQLLTLPFQHVFHLPGQPIC